MFSCRFRLISRLFLPSPSPSSSLLSHVIITQRFSSRTTTPSQLCLAVPVSPHPSSSSQTHLYVRDLSPTNNKFQKPGEPHPGGLPEIQKGSAFPFQARKMRRQRLIRAIQLPCPHYMHISTHRSSRSSLPNSLLSRSAVSRYARERQDNRWYWIISQETFWIHENLGVPSLR
ncbi:hypothetical protein B0F90DRAFT_1246959 [Multifurca ochricompacta]|uniref:Uncharacterized protein n=1 Tax=Multifurca ochricompacta TaxID=376703 RepID=A0AAD4QQ34_9AGAM|nr:hypothetical protein B0F90DRAFT_1246959 [Multifurca ochricompacta]